MADTNKITLVQKLTDIADGFRTSRSLTDQLSLDEMAVLAAVPIGGGENKLAQFVDGTLTDITAEDLEGATKINQYAFYYNQTVKSIGLPNTVTNIDSSAFAYSKLETINFPEGLTNIAGSAFYQGALKGSITLPSSLRSIGSGAFSYCKLTEVIILEGIRTLPQNMLYSCYSMRNIVIPNSVTEIGSLIFSDCSNLLNITIPSSVTKMGNSVFIGNNRTINGRTVIFLSTTPPVIGTTIFNKNINFKIIVPKGCGDAYKSATNFAEYADYIEEASV